MTEARDRTDRMDFVSMKPRDLTADEKEALRSLIQYKLECCASMATSTLYGDAYVNERIRELRECIATLVTARIL